MGVLMTTAMMSVVAKLVTTTAFPFCVMRNHRVRPAKSVNTSMRQNSIIC